MRYLLTILSFCYWGLNLVSGQAVLRSEEEVSRFRAIPAERIFMHTNTSFLLNGEYLYYMLYCLDIKESRLSNLSKVGYVELIGKGGESVFRHKVLLQNGVGNGDFFLPTEVPSGTYKLVAYTQWMRNQGQASFYQSNITIVNPYRSNQPQLQKSNIVEKDSLALALDTLGIKKDKKQLIENVGPLQMVLNAQIFGKREKVSLTLKGMDERGDPLGSYSVSVRRKYAALEPFRENIYDLLKQINVFEDTNVFKEGDNIFLPELRGELLNGKVVALEEGYSVKNLKVAVSIPGEDYVLEVVQTDELGKFLVNLTKNYIGERVFLQVVSPNPEVYQVQLIEQKAIDYTQLEFSKIDIDLSMREVILQRSVHNQIENSYFQFRPDSTAVTIPDQFLGQMEQKTYALDDYTRFKTLRETLVEIIQDVSFKRIDKANFVIRVKPYDYTSVADIPPLILLDGGLFQDDNILLNFDARTIDEISVYRQKLVFGPEIYEGALMLWTKEGDGFEAFQYDGPISGFDILEPQRDKKYFTQRYDGLDKNKPLLRLPDDRLQLLWRPELKLPKNEFEIDFFSSDVLGEFEICLEGLTGDGRPVFIRKSFVVK